MVRYQDSYDTTERQARPRAAQTVRQVMPTPQNPTPGFRRPPQYPTLPQAQYGQAGYQTPQFPGFRPTSEFAADPTTANFERLMNFQIPYYMQPVQQRDYLGESAPAYGQLMNTISSILGQTMAGPSPGESALMSIYGSLAGGGNADAYANEYRSYLNQEPFTGAEWEAYRTESLEPIEADRATAVNRALREISDQGIDPSSGIAQAKLREVNAAYDANRAGAQNKLAISANQLRAQRKGQAFEAGLSAEQLKNQAKSAAASAAGGAANAWANRLGMGANVAGMGHDAALQRAQMGYGVDANLRGEQYQNFNTAMQLSQIMSNLPAQRQAEALQLMQGYNPSNTMDMTNTVAQQRIAQQNAANQGYANTWGGLGSMLGYFGQMFPTSGGGQYRDPGFTTGTLPFPVGQTPYVPETYQINPGYGTGGWGQNYRS